MSDTILIVEDDDLVASTMGEALGDEGYRPALAKNGQEALAYLQSHPPPCMILLDLGMPVMDGYSFRREQLADEALAAIPTIVMTGGYVDRRLVDLNVTGWLRKPTGLDSLLSAVKHTARLSPAAADDAPDAALADVYDDDLLLEGVCSFLRSGLHDGEAVVVIATEPSWERILEQLRREDVETSSVLESGQLLRADAAAVLTAVMADGVPSPDQFERLIGEVLGRAAQFGRDCRVRIYGEMVNLLWQRGNVASAIRIEQLWNALLRRHPFSLYCSYLVDGDAMKSADCLAAIAEVHAVVAGRQRVETGVGRR